MKRYIIALVALFAATIATAQQPLYVIDGRKATAEEIEKIISTNIESMTVIHDEEAKAAYSHMGDTTNGVVLVYTHKESATDEVWLAADVMPKFMGGDAASFQRWVMQNIKYPAEAIEKGIQGQVNVRFIVGKDGKVDTNRLMFLDKCDNILHQEVIRVLDKAPAWTPAVQKGKIVEVQLMIPVVFAL